MSKVTVHPDALAAAMDASRKKATWKDTLEVLLQWYIDNPQITAGQCQKLRRSTPDNEENNLYFIREFLTLALSGKPEVPQELKTLLMGAADGASLHTINNRIAEAFYAGEKLGKGAK